MKNIYVTNNIKYKKYMDYIEVYGYELSNDNLKIMVEENEKCIHPDFLIFIINNKYLKHIQVNTNNQSSLKIQIDIIDPISIDNKIISINEFIKYHIGFKDEIIIYQEEVEIYKKYMMEKNIQYKTQKTEKKTTSCTNHQHRLDSILNMIDSSEPINYYKIINSDNIFSEFIITLKDKLNNFGIKQIMTHVILPKKETDKILNSINKTTNNNNIIPKFLNRNYIRQKIHESFIYEYNAFMNFNKIYEISEVFNIENKTEQTNIMLSLHIKHNILEHVKIITDAFNMPNRIYIYEYHILYVDKNLQTYKMSSIIKYHHHYIIELNAKQMIELATKNRLNDNKILIEDINIESFNETDAIKQLLNDCKIIGYKLIDIYKPNTNHTNKFTFRIEKED